MICYKNTLPDYGNELVLIFSYAVMPKFFGFCEKLFHSAWSLETESSSVWMPLKASYSNNHSAISLSLSPLGNSKDNHLSAEKPTTNISVAPDPTFTPLCNFPSFTPLCQPNPFFRPTLLLAVQLVFAGGNWEGAGVEGQICFPHWVVDQRVPEREDALRHNQGNYHILESSSSSQWSVF